MCMGFNEIWFLNELKATTRCVIAEGEALGPQLSGAVLIAKRFHLRKCSHHKDAVPATECIKSMIGKMTLNLFVNVYMNISASLLLL